MLYNTKVQGNDAEKEIARGIEFFSDYDGVDVVVVARGGGSLEDLAAYNTEIVARATYACNKPIVSAVGHETDFTIIDFVSDLRAPTPSAAAELLTQDTKTSAMALKKDIARVSRALDQYVADKTMQFSNDKNLLVSLAEDFVGDKKIYLDKLASKIANKAESFASENDYALKLKLAHLNKLNPLDILSLGYAKIEQNQKSVSCKNQLDENAEFEIYFVDGQVIAKGVGK